jgi:LPXTG-motif cell wall-anchored protein
MGPYYRGTSSGLGAFFDTLYEHPIIMLLVILGMIGLGVFLWRRKKSEETSGL